ncbi:MAG TPA: flagellar export chaperone FlgN [Planctomycetota bacterium]|nr:flagellar export chaperone FlgN [Planctomycetota bacterium]
MNRQVLVEQLERYATEELELQSNTLLALREQETALFHGNLDAMRANVERVDAQLRNCSARSAKRQELLRRFGLHFGVAPSTLTLASICTRLGGEGEELSRIAVSLRETTLAVSRTTRRLGALARMHARLNDEILREVLATQGVDPKELEHCGALLDASV